MVVASAAHRSVRAALVDVDPELGDVLDARERADARRRAIVHVLELRTGVWLPESLHAARSRPFALLIVEGLVVREQLLGASRSIELLGPGDLVDSEPATEPLIPTSVHWSVPEVARVTVLDDRMLAAMRAWPAIGRVLLVRAARRTRRLATHRAIAQLPRVDLRLVALFAFLGERWGRVAAAGVVVPLHLTHETLGRLIGARRPTVSLALKELNSDGLLERRADGSWLLSSSALATFAPHRPPVPGASLTDVRTILAP